MTARPILWPGIAFGLCLAVLAAYQQLKLPPVLPILLEEYGFGRLLAGGFMSIYALIGLLLSVRLGRMMQRNVGRYLNAAFALFVLAAGIMLTWPENGGLFLLGRALEGVGFAILAIAGPSICTASAGSRGLAIAAAAIATWIPLGNLIPNALSAGFGDVLGWRGLWWFGLAATAAMALWTRTWRGHATLEGGAPADANAPDGKSPDPAQAERWRAMRLSALLFTLWSIQMFAYFTWVPAYLVETYGVTMREAATLFLVPIIILTVFNLVAAPLLRRGLPVALLLGGSAVAQAAIWVVIPHSSDMVAGVLALVVYAVAAGFIPTCLFATPGTIFGAGPSLSRAFGVLMAGRNLGVLIGPVLTGVLVDATDDWALVARVFGAVSLCVGAGAFVLHRWLRQLPA
jgi:predicted MFS family arabinose efflux permease